MIVPRILDLDRLHNAVELVTGEHFRHRREGKTVAMIMLMLGEVELGGQHNNYLYIGHNAFFTSMVMREFKRVVGETLPNVVIASAAPHKVVINGTQQFFFVSATELIKSPEHMRGWSLDRLFVDLDTLTQQRLDKSGLSAMFNQLLPQLAERRGDVI